MSESVRRRKYRYDRVLIESDRVLNPQFDDGVLFFTGAQIEMLRNVSQYLRRLDTYVTEYNPGYYIAPTAEDYDSILEIVADMEETLMGNNNVIFGYESSYNDIASRTVSGAGDETLNFGSVPAGKVLRLEGAWVRNVDTVCTKILVRVSFPGGNHYIIDVDSPPANVMQFFNGMVTLPAGSDMGAVFYDCADGDHIRCGLNGYIMDVP